MYNAKVVLPILLVFIAILTYPLWSSSNGAQPKLATPKGEACVESVEYMRANHMKLLDEWRNSVVRDQNHVHISSHTGIKHQKSLTKTCLACHDNKEQFCDSCHTYSSVEPYCWSCHVDPNTANPKEAANGK